MVACDMLPPSLQHLNALTLQLCIPDNPGVVRATYAINTQESRTPFQTPTHTTANSRCRSDKRSSQPPSAKHTTNSSQTSHAHYYSASASFALVPRRSRLTLEVKRNFRRPFQSCTVRSTAKHHTTKSYPAEIRSGSHRSSMVERHGGRVEVA